MSEKRLFCAKAALFLTLLLFGTVLFSVIAVAPLDCSYKNTACAAGETKVLGFSNYTNAHAELPGQRDYNWNVCCKVQGTPSMLSTDCLGANTNVTGLNSSDGTGVTNAHLEIAGYAGIPSPSLACLSAANDTVLCFTKNESCPSQETCLFTQSNLTNAHAGDCGQQTGSDIYGWRTCCRFCPPDSGAEGQRCCAGLCQAGLICKNNVCVISERICPNGFIDPGETCQNCPQDVGTCPGDVSNSTVYGYVTNATGKSLPNAKVEALSKSFTHTDVSGYYQLALRDPSSGSPYDLVASSSGYESQTLNAFEVPDYVSIRQDFTLTNYRGNCNDDCTTVGSNLCSASCHGKGTCFYSSPEVMNACDGTFGWTELPDGRFVNCCKGQPISPTKASSVSVPCASSLTKSQKIVLYLGKLVKMNILTFKC